MRFADHHVQETWEGDNNVLIQQAAKYLLDLVKAKFKGKETNSIMCESWITIESVSENRFKAQNCDDVYNGSYLIEALQHRINASIQEIVMLLQEKVMV
jgi:acyl-CoA oxidase